MSYKAPQNINTGACTLTCCCNHLQQLKISARIPFLKSFYSLSASAMSFGNDWFPLGICANGDVLFINTAFQNVLTYLASTPALYRAAGLSYCGVERKGGVVFGEAEEGFPWCGFKYTLRHRQTCCLEGRAGGDGGNAHETDSLRNIGIMQKLGGRGSGSESEGR